MNTLYYQFPGTWFGDCMPFGKDDTYFLFHQRDNRNPGPFGEPFGWDLATTKDFVTYEDHGVAIPRGDYDAQDQFIFAGSVFEGEGRYHIFYTGYNRDYSAQGKAAQVLLHAVSDDLYHWEKTGDKVELPPQPGYDPDEWRDPWIIRDDEHNRYVLVLGTRKAGPKEEQTGCTVWFTSTDLEHWEFQGDFWTPNIYTMHEMPDLFRMGDWWYHIVTEYSDKKKMVYRMSRSLEGPWTAPADDAFDGSDYYAGRTFELNGHRILFGWVGTREDNDDRKNFEWAGTFVPHEIIQHEDGSLGVKTPDTLWAAFAERQPIDDCALTADGREERIIATVDPSVNPSSNPSNNDGRLFSLEADVTFAAGTRNFGIRFYENATTKESYQFHFPVAENRFISEKNPNYIWFSFMNIGLERPIALNAGETYHLRLIVDDTVATLYVNDVALNTRVCEHHGDAIGFYVTDGSATLSNISLAVGLR
ncbi:glycoside hydrolase family 32 protein [Bifidobacterium biavatii]|uniref:beta-fructofuranosidase n=1 Tax=Bifidobacterium biavatii DSM 23969 TaxID=1437608 RepID=A0A086ZNJ4_9BIFI|nr:glycoside hydrolase family 32 protein [Bifidobacterium biavatii]KFI48094.1 Glycosyl hydrolases family 32, Beta-fructosidase or sucrose-6-phosphate hydrolase [Bifidobacterium biavatii DSM 23969]